MNDDLEPGFCPRRRWMWENNETEQHFQASTLTYEEQFKREGELLRSYVLQERPIREISTLMNWEIEKVYRRLRVHKLRLPKGTPDVDAH